MDTQILKLNAPFDYIYCNGELGKHIATYIVGESHVDEDGKYMLETHSHPIVQYQNSPKGVVWNRAELTDCVVLCNEDDMRVDINTFCWMSYALFEAKYKAEEEASNTGYVALEPREVAQDLKNKLTIYGIGFKTDDDSKEMTLEVETLKVSDGFVVQSLEPDFIWFNIQGSTKEEVLETLKEERKDWEEFFDNVIKIRFLAQGIFPEDVEAL